MTIWKRYSFTKRSPAIPGHHSATILSNTIESLTPKRFCKEYDRVMIREKRSEPQFCGKSCIFHLKTIWLFTLSDLKTIIGPETTFGLASAIAAQAFGITAASVPAYSQILRRSFLVGFWTWSNLLPFAIDNQRQPAAIMEDSLNKPWRPLPSKRLSPEQAKKLMFGLYPLAFLLSTYVGGVKQCVALMLLGYWYNDCGGADTSCITRNFINACGFTCYSSGAMEVALGRPLPLLHTPKLLRWFLVIGGVVFSTVHVQDMYDQAGDIVRGRKTVPLILGDHESRLMTVFPMALWSFLCPWVWGSSLMLHIASVMLGLCIILRLLLKRSVIDDKMTFRLWNIWVVFIYFLPLAKHLGRT